MKERDRKRKEKKVERKRKMPHRKDSKLTPLDKCICMTIDDDDDGDVR